MRALCQHSGEVSVGKRPADATPSPPWRRIGLVGVALLTVALFGLSAPVQAQSTAVTISNVTIDADKPTAGETFVVSARITNNQGATSSLSLNEVYLRTPGGRSRVSDDLGSLPPGTSTTVDIPVEVDRPGWHTLQLRVHGLDERQRVVTVSRPVPVNVFGDRSDSVSIAATADEIGPSNRSNIRISVANGLNEVVTGVELHVSSDSLLLPEPRRVTSQLSPGNLTRFTLPVREAEAGQHGIEVTLNYTADDGTRRTVTRTLTTEIQRVPQPGRVELTGIQVEPGEAGLTIRGSASNAGTTDVAGVTIGVQRSPTAAPAEDASTFFVGSIPSSDFNSFEVRAVARTNGTVTIPLRVNYVVDGVRTNRSVEVTHEFARPTDGTDSPSGSGGPPILLIGGALVAVVLVVVGWRRMA